MHTPCTHRPLAAGLVALAAGLALVALLGPLTGGPIEYHVTETLRDQTIGLDAVSLLVVAPLTLVAATLSVRGHAGGPMLALACGPYTAYMFVQYVVGPDYLGLPGNNELLFPLYVLLLSLGWTVAVAAWNALRDVALPRDRRHERRLGRFVLPALAFLAFSRYVPALADAMGDAPAAPGYTAGPAFFWAVAMLDLGVLLPATVAACRGLVRGTAWAPRALYLVAGWLGLVGPAVAAMAIVMVVDHDPNASGASAALMTILGVAFGAVAVLVWRPVLTGAQRSRAGNGRAPAGGSTRTRASTTSAPAGPASTGSQSTSTTSA